MAKTQKFDEGKLLEAVNSYAEVFKHKTIKATQLAEWARANVEGLDGVRDYHFTRPKTVKDPKTGQKTAQKKECTKRIEEINNERSIARQVAANTLLQSADIDAFFGLTKTEQRRLILSTREQVDALAARNRYLEQQSQLIQAENERVSTVNDELQSLLKDISKKQTQMDQKLTKIIGQISEKGKKDALAEIGITEQMLELSTFKNSLSESIGEAFSISKTIKNDRDNEEKADELLDDLLGGLDF